MQNVKTNINQTAVTVESLADLPIDVAEAMYSPDFVELSSTGAGGVPLSLPMSFSLDLVGNCVRFSSPLTAGRLAAYGRDPRCSVLFSRVTTGHPAILLQGVVTLGEVAEGVRRAPARRFTVTPRRVLTIEESPRLWELPAVTPAEAPATLDATVPRRAAGAAAPATPADLEAIVRFPSTVATLRDAEGWPLALPAELRHDDGAVIVTLPDSSPLLPEPGPSSLLGHTWTKDGPRYLALTGRSEFLVPGSWLEPTQPSDERRATNQELVFRPSRALRRP